MAPSQSILAIRFMKGLPFPRMRVTSFSTASSVESIVKPGPLTTDRAELLIEIEHARSAHNYHPLPVVLNRGAGVYVWDVNDKVFSSFEIQVQDFNFLFNLEISGLPIGIFGC